MRKTLSRLAALTAVALAPPLAAQASSDQFPSREGQVEFVLPSHNIGCTYTPGPGTSWYDTMDGRSELTCDRVEPSYVRVFLGTRGKAQKILNSGEQACCSTEPVLEYGESWSSGDGYTCLSSRAGLTCNYRGRHGFSISRKAITSY